MFRIQKVLSHLTIVANESKETFKIRCVNDECEVENIFVQWAQNEGWNLGKFDGKPFYLADKEGFFVGELNGQVICCIACAKYSDDYSCAGLYIVDPKFRHKGYGMKMYKVIKSRMFTYQS